MGVRPMDIKPGEVSPGGRWRRGLRQRPRTSAMRAPMSARSRWRFANQGASSDGRPGHRQPDAFSAGGSGSLVLNCQGQVVESSNLIDERYPLLFGAWGARGRPTAAALPNAFAVRIVALQNLYASLSYASLNR